MTIIAGKPFTQLLNLNLVDELRIKGDLVAANPFQRITINKLSDFPTPSGGTITLNADTQYLIGDDINIGTDNLTFGLRTALVGLGIVLTTITYTGTAAMINSTRSVSVDKLNLSAPNGRYFDHNDTIPSLVNYNDLTLAPSKGLGTFASTANSLLFIESTFANFVVGDGYEFSGTWGLFQINDGSIMQNSGEAIKLNSAVFLSLNIQAVAFTLNDAGSVAFTGAANSANVAVNGLAKVSNCFITNPGGGTLLSGIDQSDDRWRFFNSTLIRDTKPDGLASFSGGVAETVIATQSVPVKVNATFTVDSTSQFTATTDGRFTFDGSPDVRLPIDVRLTGVMASGGEKTVQAFIALNGTVITNSAAPFFPTGTKASTANLIWQQTFTTGDFIEIFVANEDDTVNFIAQSAVVRIN